MLHTAKLYLILEEKEVYNIEKIFQGNIKLISNKLDELFSGVKTTFTKRYSKWFLFVTIDFIELLGNNIIQEKDYADVEKKLNEFLQRIGFSLNDLTLLRIDYRVDVVIKDKIEREILFHIYKKSLERYRFKKKYDKYQNSIYFNSKSTQIIVYDKEEERNSKVKKIQKYEENVLRFEVRLQNKHLNYMKNKRKVEKKLDNYFKETVYKKYVQEHLIPLFYKGHYYKIYIAEQIINKSNYKENDKVFLREFLVYVSKNNINMVTQKYTKYKFNKALDLLQTLNINPILIPKNLKCKSTMKNPLQILK